MRHASNDGVPASVIGRVLTLLTAFTAPDTQLSLSELARRSGIPKPTAHRLVAELVEWGVLERGAKGEVRVGLLLFELGQLASRQRTIREAAQPFLADLHEATGLTTHLGILDRDSVVYIDKIPALDGPQLPSRVGGRMPLYCTAIGKVLLASAGEELIRSVVGGELKRRTPYTLCVPGLLLQQLERIRQTGLAYEQEESTRGVVCVASPITSRGGNVVAALSISGWSNRIEIPKSGQAVRTAALALSRQISAGVPSSTIGIRIVEGPTN